LKYQKIVPKGPENEYIHQVERQAETRKRFAANTHERPADPNQQWLEFEAQAKKGQICRLDEWHDAHCLL
jgi:hypothetical protein